MSFISGAIVAGLGFPGMATLGVAGISAVEFTQNAEKKKKQKLIDAQKAGLATLQQAEPSMVAAGESAAAEVERKRRIRALSGGKTLLTDETLGNQGGASPKSLLGA